MSWYVFALVDAVPSGPPGKGLRGTLSIRRVAGALAVVERRADVPPAEFGTLQRHQAVVERLAAAVPAILPVRFGTLLDDEEIAEALQERDEEIADALDLVRDRVQYTWRRIRGRRRGDAASAQRPEARGAVGEIRGGASSGAEYLRRAARAAKPAPPAPFRSLRSTLRPQVAADRYQPATAALPEALYHLVDRAATTRYESAAVKLQERNPALTVTGPFPPFAFAADIL